MGIDLYRDPSMRRHAQDILHRDHCRKGDCTYYRSYCGRLIPLDALIVHLG
jgi:hypothetical protein